MAQPYALHSWMVHRLQFLLGRDLKQGRIANEADLQCCVNFHLRKFVDSVFDLKWRIQNKPAVLGGWRESAKFPDIVIAHAYQPKYAIELKDLRGVINRDSINRDRQKLRLMGQRIPSVSKGYFVYIIK